VRAVADMFAFAESGVTAFDCADIYTGVEELIGQFLRAWRDRHGGDAPAIRVHTKCVPDQDALASLARADIERSVDRSLRRLGVERLDLVQLDWRDFDVTGAVEAAQHLAACRSAFPTFAVADSRHSSVISTPSCSARYAAPGSLSMTAHSLSAPGPSIMKLANVAPIIDDPSPGPS
jgi:hypothetical protein